MIESSFVGKHALVTGGASGIGREIALRLARAGCGVCILDIAEEAAMDTVRTLHGLGAPADALTCSCADERVENAISAYLDEQSLGGFDFLANAAGISPKLPNGRRQSAWEITPSEWRRVMDVNLNGCFHTLRAVLPPMIRRGGGAIVNISSLAGRRYTAIAGAAYATSKAGIEAMTRQFAGEAAPFGIRINAVAPGRIETPMSHLAGADFNEDIRLSTPLRRLGMPSDVADAVLFLLSDRASFITGETLVVSGGRGL